MELTTEQRLTRLEALVDILLDERKILHERLAAVGTTSMTEKRNDNIIQGWQYHPDGDFGKPVAPSGNPTETDDSDKHLSESDEYVDLGLPSGIKWAKCNIGASKCSDFGDYYYFDEAVELTKNRDVKMPSKEDFAELLANTKHLVTGFNGVPGMRFVSKRNENSIFIPFSGYISGTETYGIGKVAYVLSSTDYDSEFMWCLFCKSVDSPRVCSNSRIFKNVLRPVKD